MLKKKRYGLIVTCIFVLGIILPSGIKAEAAENTNKGSSTEELIIPVNLSNEDRANFIELGFTDDELDTMTQDEFDQYSDLDGKLTNISNSYYRIVTDSKGNVLSTTEVPEKTALIQSSESFIKPRASNTTKTKWLSMTTTSSKLSNGNILLKNSFKWLKNPEMALTDVVAISHSASAVKVPGTEGFSYKYTDGRGTHRLKAISTTRNGRGIAKKFNLKKIGTDRNPYNHNGYISIQVKKGNKNDIRANAFGHYTHVTLGLTGTIDIKTGSISVGGNLKKSNMTDTMILFKY